MGLFGEAVKVSVYANAEAVIICSAGVVAVMLAIVDQPMLKKLARMLVKILFPLFTFSNFRVYSPERVREWAVVFLCSALTLALQKKPGQGVVDASALLQANPLPRLQQEVFFWEYLIRLLEVCEPEAVRGDTVAVLEVLLV